MNLVHLALIDNKTGYDLPRDTRFELVPVYEVEGGILGDNLYDTLKPLNIPNEEGFVIRQVSDGTFPDWRCKIKFEDYVRLHKLMTNCTNVDIWECLYKKSNFNMFIENVPDEFYQFVKKIQGELEAEYASLLSQSELAYNDVVNLPSRKDQAIALNKNHANVSSIVFKMLDNSPHEELIWKKIKPQTRLCPFWNLES
jgi:RNA ligase